VALLRSAIYNMLLVSIECAHTFQAWTWQELVEARKWMKHGKKGSTYGLEVEDVKRWNVDSLTKVASLFTTYSRTNHEIPGWTEHVTWLLPKNCQKMAKPLQD
jgi:hypothetical protein